MARFKLQRRLLTELPGLGKPGALERRPYPPGEHGLKRKKYSEFALQLEEKQKVRINYVLRESQLQRFIAKAKQNAKSDWVDALVSLLERRLDNVVFRLGFAPSIRGARQLVSHGKVLVNGRKVDIASVVLQVNDVVELKQEVYENQVYLYSSMEPRLPLPDYLVKDKSKGYETGRVQSLPNFGHLPFPMNPGLFTSYYSL